MNTSARTGQQDMEEFLQGSEKILHLVGNGMDTKITFLIIVVEGNDLGFLFV